jgi:hypothetical protein
MKKLIVSLLSLFLTIQLFSQDTVKVFVALWDSPPKSDLYWGMKYGIKICFSNDTDWEPVKILKVTAK